MLLTLGYCHPVHYSMELSAVMQKIRWAILLLGIVVLMAAMIQNSATAPLKLFFYETELPVSVLLLVTAAISFLIGAITTGRMLRRAAKAKATSPSPPEKSGPSEKSAEKTVTPVTPPKTNPF
jgi:uncharacterized integral membrane protein